MWSFKIKNEISVSELIGKILNEADTIEGITLLGGEPLDQFGEVQQLLLQCRKLSLSTMVFTGYEMAEVLSNGMASILEHSDILITGRYDETKRTMNHQWIGSANQEIHFLTEQYKNFEMANSNYVEISIDEFGKTEILGFPDDQLLKGM